MSVQIDTANDRNSERSIEETRVTNVIRRIATIICYTRIVRLYHSCKTAKGKKKRSQNAMSG